MTLGVLDSLPFESLTGCDKFSSSPWQTWSWSRAPRTQNFLLTNPDQKPKGHSNGLFCCPLQER